MINAVFENITDLILNYISEMDYTDYSNRDISEFIDWLSLCGHIENISVSPDSSDESFLSCRPAYEYEMNRADFVSQISCELARFHFACSALECIIRYFKINSKKTNKGLGFSLATIYKEKYLLKHVPEKYFTLYALLLERFKHNSYYTKDLEDFYKKIDNDLIDESGYGIILVYKLRNHFAHGSLSLSSQFGDCNEDNKPDITLISLSSLIVLINIIFILMLDPISDQSIIDPIFLDIPSGQKAKIFLENIISNIRFHE